MSGESPNVLTLVVTGDDGTERWFEMGPDPIHIGRSPDSDVVLLGADRGVSRAHAEVRFENGRHVIVDMHSQNGTWLNGQRVQRADVGPGSEISVGMYRLRVLAMAPGSAPRQGVPPPRPTPAQSSAPLAAAPAAAAAEPAGSIADLELRTHEVSGPLPPMKAAEPGAEAGARWPLLVGAAILLALLGVSAWWLRPSAAVNEPEPRSEPQASVAPGGAAPAVAPPPAADAASPAPTVDAGASVTDADARPAAAPAPQATESAAAASTEPRSDRGPRVEGPVVQKPGESVQAWRDRSAALQTRYAFSQSALNRKDFAAAAGGFEAILKDEPGYLDAPRLLVAARGGLHAAARDAYAAGRRLDKAGDWIAALAKFDQAIQIDPTISGVADASKRVREKMRLAGNDALKRARLYDTLERTSEAIREYDKAAEWLSAEDPNHDLARNRSDQLKAAKR